MPDSVWTGTIEAFRARVGGTGPVPAGVAVSAVSGSLALALVAKVLDITGRRRSFEGDRVLLNSLVESARAESAALTRLADEDVEAFDLYLEATRSADAELIAKAASLTIKVPMEGARAAVRGLDLCVQAIGLVSGLTAADLGIAAKLLDAAVRAMLLSVDFNVKQMNAGEELLAERRNIEARSIRQAEAVAAGIRSCQTPGGF
jgi:formiminotetrahydrofolate cyclodeaminase